MGKLDRAVYTPNEDSAAAYDRLYAEYRELHDYFGRGGNDVMHRLRALRRDALAGRGSDAASGPAPRAPGRHAAETTVVSSDTETPAVEGVAL